MTTIRQGLLVVVAVAVVWGQAGTAGAAGLTAAQKCEARKNQAAGELAKCLEDEQAKAVQGQAPNFAQCSVQFQAAFAKAEAAAAAGTCPTAGDATAIEARVDTTFADIAAGLTGSTPLITRLFPATGQTTCWNSAGTVVPCAGTGQDGDLQAGGKLGYTDNGDGTITDNNTGLMWEKKSADGSIHDKDSTHTWANAFAVHIAGLNAANFAGHNYWRLPNVNELQSLVNYENLFPSVSSAFNKDCAASCTVLTCSCTASPFHWSSSTNAGVPSDAWIVNFGIGGVNASGKSFTGHVRAVRGGL